LNVAFNEIFQSAAIWRARRFWAMTGAGKDMGRSVAANWRKRAWRSLFLAAVLGFSAGPVCAQAATAPAPAAAAEVFTVADVPVDATAASANVARDTARLAGERAAYRMLLARLTLASDAGRLPAASDAMLTDLVQGFEVAKERTSTVRYLAEYAFRFRPDGIRQLLRQARVPFAETPSKPLVVLPVLVADRGPALWEDPNPWRAAWNQKKFPTGLVPMILPLGEVEDLAAIDADLALKGDAAAISRISARDGKADVLVAVATVKGAGDGATGSKLFCDHGRETHAATLGKFVGQRVGQHVAVDAAATATLVAAAHHRAHAVLQELPEKNGFKLTRHGCPLLRRVEVPALQRRQVEDRRGMRGGTDGRDLHVS